jgi:hypothetical protein
VPLEKRPHRRQRLGRERGGGIVVEVDHEWVEWRNNAVGTIA